MVEEIVKNCVGTAVKKIHEKEGLLPPEEPEKLALAKTVAGMSQKIITSMKPYETLLDKYLSIPDYVILPEDRKHEVIKYKAVSEADMLNVKIQSQMLEAEVTEVSKISPGPQNRFSCHPSSPQTAKIIRALEEERSQYEKIQQSFEDVEAALDLVESRLAFDLKPTEQKKAIKYIEGLILDKNEN